MKWTIIKEASDQPIVSNEEIMDESGYNIINAAIAQLRAAPRPRNLVALIHPRDPFLKYLAKHAKKLGFIRNLTHRKQRHRYRPWNIKHTK
jgi:hypothetical protein